MELTHLSPEDLFDFAGGGGSNPLDVDRSRAVEAHLLGCRQCEMEVVRLRSNWLPPDRMRALLFPPRRLALLRRPTLRRVAAVAAASLLLAAGLWFALPKGGPLEDAPGRWVVATPAATLEIYGKGEREARLGAVLQRGAVVVNRAQRPVALFSSGRPGRLLVVGPGEAVTLDDLAGTPLEAPPLFAALAAPDLRTRRNGNEGAALLYPALTIAEHRPSFSFLREGAPRRTRYRVRVVERAFASGAESTLFESEGEGPILTYPRDGVSLRYDPSTFFAWNLEELRPGEAPRLLGEREFFLHKEADRIAGEEEALETAAGEAGVETASFLKAALRIRESLFGGALLALLEARKAGEDPVLAERVARLAALLEWDLSRSRSVLERVAGELR